jgi:hypothetical protein
MRVDRDLSRLRPRSTVRDLVLLRSTLLMTVAAIVVGGCGDQSDDVAAGSTEIDQGTAGGEADRYCLLMQELDTAAREANAAIEDAGTVTAQEAAQAAHEFLDAHAELIDELGDAAPIEIRDDVQLLYAAAAEDLEPGAEIPDEFRAAGERIDAFHEAHCEALWMLPPELAEGSNPYCEAVRAVVVMPEAIVRSDRPQYRAAIAKTIERSPDEQRPAWQAFLTFIDDDSTENFNHAAGAIEEIGTAIREDCQINLVLDDWDLLRHLPMTDKPGVYVE